MSTITIVELTHFCKKASRILSDKEREELHLYIAHNPHKGDVIAGTGGARKLRWAAGGRGKRGGARVIYFYHVVGITVYLMTCYAKNERDDLSPADKKQLKAIIEQIKKGA